MRAAVWLAVIEGVFIVFHVISAPIAIVLGIAIIVLYFTSADRLSSYASQQVAWIAAVSQALVMLVPVLLFVLWSIALMVVAILAVVAVVLLISRRR